jgi:CheY-like chemotaxis protein
MHGILARGGHRFAAADSATSALALLRRNVRVDLVFTELKLAEGDGLALIRQIKANRLLRPLPIVVYTEQVNRQAVKSALDLQAQNYLIKPYQDDSLFAEIERAEKNPWRAGHFEEEKSFCRLMGLSTEELHRLLDQVRTALQVARPAVEAGATRRDRIAVGRACAPLEEQAEAAGAWGAVEALHQLTELAEAGLWESFPAALTDLDFAIELIAHWLDPQRTCPDFLEHSGESAGVGRRGGGAAAGGMGRRPDGGPVSDGGLAAVAAGAGSTGGVPGHRHGGGGVPDGGQRPSLLHQPPHGSGGPRSRAHHADAAGGEPGPPGAG